MSDDNDGMVYSRPGGMSQQERAKTLRRLGGGVLPNASGARQEAPAILAGSEPSRELKAPELTPEEIAATAKANRQARAAAQADPVNGTVDPLDDDAATLEEVRRMASAGEPLIDIGPTEADTPVLTDVVPTATDSLLD